MLILLFSLAHTADNKFTISSYIDQNIYVRKNPQGFILAVHGINLYDQNYLFTYLGNGEFDLFPQKSISAHQKQWELKKTSNGYMIKNKNVCLSVRSNTMYSSIPEYRTHITMCDEQDMAQHFIIRRAIDNNHLNASKRHAKEHERQSRQESIMLNDGIANHMHGNEARSMPLYNVSVDFGDTKLGDEDAKGSSNDPFEVQSLNLFSDGDQIMLQGKKHARIRDNNRNKEKRHLKERRSRARQMPGVSNFQKKTRDKSIANLEEPSSSHNTDEHQEFKRDAKVPLFDAHFKKHGAIPQFQPLDLDDFPISDLKPSTDDTKNIMLNPDGLLQPYISTITDQLSDFLDEPKKEKRGSDYGKPSEAKHLTPMDNDNRWVEDIQYRISQQMGKFKNENEYLKNMMEKRHSKKEPIELSESITHEQNI